MLGPSLGLVLALSLFAIVPWPGRGRRTATGRPPRDPASPHAPTAAAPAASGDRVRAVGPLGRTLLADIAAEAVRRGRAGGPSVRAGGRGHARRRAVRIVLAGSVLLSVGFGGYLWQVMGALSDAERAMVVPLPAGANESLPAEGPVATTVPPPGTPTPAGAAGGRLEAAGTILNAATADEDPGLDPVWRGKRTITVLVLGLDTRDGDSGPPRSDVFLLARLDLLAKTVQIVSVPRDLWLTVPGWGEERINAAYPLGWRAEQPAAGVALTKRTVEQNFGIAIDYYIAVDFRGFQQVVDAVGGVEVVVPRYLRDDEYPTEDYGIETIEFLPGPQQMDGKAALKYVRTRHPDSDYGRRRRQEQLLVALFDKGKSVGIVARLPGVLRSVGGTVQTNFTFEEQLVLGRVAVKLDRADIRLYSIDETMTSGWTTPSGAEVIRGDWTQIRALIERAFGPRPG